MIMEAKMEYLDDPVAGGLVPASLSTSSCGREFKGREHVVVHFRIRALP